MIHLDNVQENPKWTNHEFTAENITSILEKLFNDPDNRFIAVFLSSGPESEQNAGKVYTRTLLSNKDFTTDDLKLTFEYPADYGGGWHRETFSKNTIKYIYICFQIIIGCDRRLKRTRNGGLETESI